MRVLVVDDDADTALYLSNLLKQKNFVTEVVHNGYDALHSLKSISYDVVLLDIDLPYINGREVLQKIRKLNINIPVIIISALASVKEKVNVFAFGADDYITKPFDSREFLARIEAVNRRAIGVSSSVVSCGNLKIDITNQIAYVDDNNLTLTKKEYIILELLITRKNSLICKESFLDHLYSSACDEPNMKIIDVFICKLRKKIIAASKNDQDIPNIQTVWGRGYVMSYQSSQKEIQVDSADVPVIKA